MGLGVVEPSCAATTCFRGSPAPLFYELSIAVACVLMPAAVYFIFFSHETVAFLSSVAQFIVAYVFITLPRATEVTLVQLREAGLDVEIDPARAPLLRMLGWLGWIALALWLAEVLYYFYKHYACCLKPSSGYEHHEIENEETNFSC